MREQIPARVFRSRRSKKRPLQPLLQYRLSRLEPLEPRCVLASPTLASLSDVALYAGSTLNIALDGADSDGDSLSYTATSTNSSVTAAISKSSNRSLKLVIDDDGDNIHGTIILQLFEDLAPKTTARIIALAESGFYDGLTFHRIIEDFMIQGGDPDGTGSGGSGTNIDDEYSSSLQFTSSGLLAMAKSQNDTGDSQFFITCEATRWLDYHHTIFGMLTAGNDVLTAIEGVSTDEDDAPVNSVVMTSVSVIQDTQDGVLRISAPAGFTGEADITVKVSDGKGGTATRTFGVVASADTANDASPYLKPIDPITTTINTPVTFTIPAADADGDTMYYSAAVDSNNTANGSKISVSVDSTTGRVTVTPASGVYGVYSIVVKVADTLADLSATSAYSVDSQVVPVYITPSAPVIEQLLPASDSGSSSSDAITNLNNSSSSGTLTFRLSGLMTDARVTIYADGNAIGQALVTDDTMDVHTSGTVALADGTHTIRVVQSLVDQAVEVGNLDTVDDLDSPASASFLLAVDTRSPQFLTTAVTRAGLGATYTYNAGTDDEADDGATYELLEAPSGMTIDAATGVIRWTPTTDQAGSHTVKVQATDTAGNVSQQTFTVKAATGPVIEAIAEQVADAGTLLQFTVAADGDNAPLSYSLGSGAPTGATIDSATGLFQWTPTAAATGATYTVVVRATDAIGLVGEAEVQIVVLRAVTEVAAPGTSLSVSMATADSALAGQTVQYSLLGTPPEGMTIDQATGLVTWAVSSDQSAETIRVVVRATAAGNESLYRDAVLRVTVARVPQLQPLDDTSVASTDSGLSLQVQAAADTSLTFSLVGDCPEGVSIDPASGVVTWHPTSQQSSGQFSFTVRVADSFGQTSERTYTLVSRSALPSNTVSASLESNDPALAGKTVEYTIVGDAPEGLTVDSQTGQVTWTVPADFQVPSGSASQAVVVLIRATASQDGSTVGFSDQILQINVSSPARVVSAALGLLSGSPTAALLASTISASRSAPVDVAASALAFAADSDLLPAPLGEAALSPGEDAVPASTLGVGGAELFGIQLSGVAGVGDTAPRARTTPTTKDWEEPTPKKRLEENASPDKRAQVPPSQPDETQQADRNEHRDIPESSPVVIQQAERDAAPANTAPESVDAAAVDAVVQAMSEDAAAEEEVLALAQSEGSEQDA